MLHICFVFIEILYLYIEIVNFLTNFQFVAHPLSQQLLKMEWQKGDASYLSTANFNGWFYAFLRVSQLNC